MTTCWDNITFHLYTDTWLDNKYSMVKLNRDGDRDLDKRHALYCAPHSEMLSWLPSHRMGLLVHSLQHRLLNRNTSWRNQDASQETGDSYYTNKKMFNLKIFPQYEKSDMHDYYYINFY